VIFAIETRTGGSFNMFSDPRGNAKLRDEAVDWLAQVGIGGHYDRRVDTIGHGECRQLEIAVALAHRPKVLLLDEPMAGMGPEESKAMTKLLTKLKGSYAILLIEHDMDAVFALADRVSVLVSGRIIFTGSVDEVRRHPEVQAAYLGGETC
jgi:branched-chain amino acid transport system ATP-binding protein